MQSMKVSDKAVEAVFEGGFSINREKYRRIKSMSKDELQRYLVDFYRIAFQDGLDTFAEQVEKEAEETEEVSVAWEDILDLIAQVKGIGPKRIQEIDKKLREAY